MEATLHEVAADLGRLALLYRTQGKQFVVGSLTLLLLHRTVYLRSL